MKLLFITLLVFAFTPPASLAAQPNSNAVVDVYKALSEDNMEAIQVQIEKVEHSTLENKQAYEGALLMKKSGLIKGHAKQKLGIFKSGKTKLESLILKEPKNAEFRFLRLIIQENAPKVVKYNRDIKEDVEMIKDYYKKFPSYLQQIIADYSKTSNELKIP